VKLAFYTGCCLEGMAGDYARSISVVFDHLVITLVEIDDWSCCGATAACGPSEMMAVALPARNLAAADKMGHDTVSACANCFNRLLFSKTIIRKNIFDIPWAASGDIAVHGMTRFLARPEIVARIEEHVRRPLKGLRTVFSSTDLLRLAFEAENGSAARRRMHVADPVPLLKTKGALP
jgi:heterodisulfide reductase subunit B